MRLLSINPLTQLALSPIDPKFFKTSAPFMCDFVTDEGTIQLRIKTGWITDLRSGCDLINGFIPKWGNPLYTACILLHDCAFSGWLSFDLANDLLRQGLVLSGEIGTLRASLAYYAVQKFGRSHYYNMEDALPHPYQTNRVFEKIEWGDK